MAIIRKTSITVKVVRYTGEVQSHQLSVSSFDELDSWILANIESTGRYEIRPAGAACTLTAQNFEDVVMKGFSILHVRPQEPAKSREPSTQNLVPGLVQELCVKEGGLGRQLEATWKTPCEGPAPAHFQVIVVNEAYGDQKRDKVITEDTVPVAAAGKKNLCVIEGALAGTVHRFEVATVSATGDVGKKRIARFCTEETYASDSKEASEILQEFGDLLTPCCADFARTHLNRGPVFLVIGKQHHGKSSFINHLCRCLGGKIDIANELEAAPPSEEETTVRTSKLTIEFRTKYSFTLCDVPAFANMKEERKKDLETLLWRADSNWARGDRRWWPVSSPPDAVIIVVSVLSWRDERDALREYLRVLQGVLKSQHDKTRRAVFPYVVAVTHKDAFLEEEGNEGRDPIEALTKAVEELKVMANTDNVFMLTNYKSYSRCSSSVTEATFRLLREATNLAKNRNASGDEVWAPLVSWMFGFPVFVPWVLGMLAMLVMIMAFVFSK